MSLRDALLLLAKTRYTLIKQKPPHPKDCGDLLQISLFFAAKQPAEQTCRIIQADPIA